MFFTKGTMYSQFLYRNTDTFQIPYKIHKSNKYPRILRVTAISPLVALNKNLIRMITPSDVRIKCASYGILRERS